MKRTIFVSIFSVLILSLNGQGKNYWDGWDFPQGIKYFYNKPCYIILSKTLHKSGWADWNEQMQIVNKTINTLKQHNPDIRIVKTASEDAKIGIDEFNEWQPMTDYVYENMYLSKDIISGEQCVVALYISDYPGPERNANLVGIIFVNVLTQKGQAGCMVMPLCYILW
jgi:hypothetical protein